MDESATGSVNFFGPEPDREVAHAAIFRPGYSLSMHLRTPSIDRGVQSFLWALSSSSSSTSAWLAVGVGKATSLLVSLVSAFLIFLFVRTRGT